MVIASEPGWLHTAGQAAGTILLVELLGVLFIMLALTAGLAFGAWWVRRKTVPILQEYTPKAEQAMTMAQQSTDRVVFGVAEFYGRRQQVETSLRVLLFGRKAAERVREDALAQAAEDLQLMSPPEAGPGPANGWTPRLQNRHAAQAPVMLDGQADQSAAERQPPAREPGGGQTPPAGTTGGSVTWRPRYNTEDEHPGASGSGDDHGNFGNLAGNAG